jgi:hypothetical protein
MKIEDVKIEDAADANFVIKKFFNGQFKNIKMEQMEQLILTVYNMGKNSGGTGVSAGSVSPAAEPPPVKVPPFKINDRVRIVEDVEIGKSGEFIHANTEGIISSVQGDKVSFLFETGEYGEMIDTSVPSSKLEKIT